LFADKWYIRGKRVTRAIATYLLHHHQMALGQGAHTILFTGNRRRGEGMRKGRSNGPLVVVVMVTGEKRTRGGEGGVGDASS